MSLDFPNTPAIGQQYSSGGNTWIFDGTAWNIMPQVGYATPSDTPPPNPTIGQLWWRASNGQMYIWYDDGNTKQWVQTSPGNALAAARPGDLYGLTVSNNATTPAHAYDVTTGYASDDVSYMPMTLQAAITGKRVDQPWLAGSGVGGWLDGSAVAAAATIHIFLMQNSTTGAVDIGLSSSLTPTLPSGYDRKRRILSLPREASVNVVITQRGDVVRRGQFTANNQLTAYAATLAYMGVPRDIVVQPIMGFTLSASAAVQANSQVGDAASGSIDINILQLSSVAGILRGAIQSGYFTNTSGQLYLALQVSSGALTGQGVTCFGWTDTRGRT